MKKSFSLINEHGFFLPYVLFIISIVFIVVTANIKIYYNEIDMMEHMTEQIKVDTLLQMATAKYINEVINEKKEPENVSYTFPSGKVKVSYQSLNKHSITVHCLVTTDRNTTFSNKNKIKLTDE